MIKNISPFALWLAFPISDYYELIRLPEDLRSPRILLSSPTSFLEEYFWISQVPAITLPTCHGLTTPQVRHNLTLAIALLRLRLRYSSGQLRVAFSERYQHFRDTASLVAYRFLCLRFTIFIQMIACFKRWKVFDNPHSPPIAQNSIRVVG